MLLLTAIRSYFNPRSSCEERHQADASRQGYPGISIHAPHARSDFFAGSLPVPISNFNPRSSCEERRHYSVSLTARDCISIHAPHARSDAQDTADAAACNRFQSTLLMRGATQTTMTEAEVEAFQSTLLMRGATTPGAFRRMATEGISIHAPHARSDLSRADSSTWVRDFNPRSSCEERL